MTKQSSVRYLSHISMLNQHFIVMSLYSIEVKSPSSHTVGKLSYGPIHDRRLVPYHGLAPLRSMNISVHW